jgi:putative endonuclease
VCRARAALARPGGEIDLICGDADGLVFVEVKKGKDHAGALARVTPRQLDRIRASAEAYAAGMPRGSLTEMRIDIALVDAQGRIAIVENATMH